MFLEQLVEPSRATDLAVAAPTIPIRNHILAAAVMISLVGVVERQIEHDERNNVGATYGEAMNLPETPVNGAAMGRPSSRAVE